jgi:hypothetical protein
VRQLAAGTSVEILGASNGWSNVRAGETIAYIRSDLLSANVPARNNVELGNMALINTLARSGTSIRIYDIRTGISYNLRVLSGGRHLDVDTASLADTEALRRSYGGRFSWEARPVFATINGRTFAAAMTGMPHSITTVRDNGVDGHFCLHFNNTIANNQRYQADLRSAVAQAWASR